MKRYFYMTIHYLPKYEDFLFVKLRDNLYVNTISGEIFRKRDVYDFGFGPEIGYELMPSLPFDALIQLIEEPRVYLPKKRYSKYTKAELMNLDCWRSNFYCAAAIIMETYTEELIHFLAKKTATDYFSNPGIRENFKVFSFDTKKTEADGHLPGCLHGKSYEDVFRRFPQWNEIASIIKNQIYR